MAAQGWPWSLYNLVWSVNDVFRQHNPPPVPYAHVNRWVRVGDEYKMTVGIADKHDIHSEMLNVELALVAGMLPKRNATSWFSLLIERAEPKKLAGRGDHHITIEHKTVQEELLEACSTLATNLVQHLFSPYWQQQLYYDLAFLALDKLYGRVLYLETLVWSPRQKRYRVPKSTSRTISAYYSVSLTPKAAFEHKLFAKTKKSMTRYNQKCASVARIMYARTKD